MSKNTNPFRLNVGFIVSKDAGYSRDFEFDEPEVHIQPDMDLLDVKGRVRVSRTAKGLLVRTNLEAKMTVECGRCLTHFEQPLKVDFTELYAFSPKTATDTGLLLPESGRIDLAPLVREEMFLAVPISPFCSPECKGLCPICGENLNETVCNHEDENIDPRLAILKSLLDEE